MMAMRWTEERAHGMLRRGTHDALGGSEVISTGLVEGIRVDGALANERERETRGQTFLTWRSCAVEVNLKGQTSLTYRTEPALLY